MPKQIKDTINDKFMMNECNEFSVGMLNRGMDINQICEAIIEYQSKYFVLKNQDERVSKLFTFKIYLCKVVIDEIAKRREDDDEVKNNT